MQFFIISHFFFIKVSLHIKMGLCFLEKNCHRISEISFLPSLKAKLLFPVCDEIPCTYVVKILGNFGHLAIPLNCPCSLLMTPERKTNIK